MTNDKETVLANASKWLCDRLKISDGDLAISDSSYESKISFHIIIQRRMKFDDLKAFKKQYSKEMTEHFIDIAPYGITQKFRMINTSKINENRPLKTITYIDDLRKHIITYVCDEEIICHEYHSDSFETFDKLIDLIPSTYANDYNTWIKIAGAINSLDLAFEDKVNLFVKFSKKSENYDGKTSCIEKLKDVKLEKIDRLYLFKLSKEANELNGAGAV
jgi:hypothetical protein